MLLTSLLPLLSLYSSVVLAHPGEEHDHSHDVEKRHFIENSHRGLEKACARRAAKRGITPGMEWAARRDEHIQQLRSAVQAKKAARALNAKRQEASSASMSMPSGSAPSGAMPSGTGAAPSGSGGSGGGSGGGGGSSSLSDYGASLLNASHHSDRTDVTLNITSTELFNSTENLCLLQPEATIGPYWVSGEYIRDDVTEDQEGVALYMTAQFLDTSSCEPVDNMYWEVWHCNSTGVYSGVIANGNGNMDDETNLNNTFLRGLTPTDDLGVATMHTLFPGHYDGRATHAHIVGHLNATVLANDTLGTGSTNNGDDTSSTVHIGQLFFDQDLITAVNAVSPYSTNDAVITLNTADSILAGEAVEGAPDPMMNYVYLGDSVEDGIYAWVTIGVDTTASYSTSSASYLTADGGVENSNSAIGGGSSMGGNGSAMGNASTGGLTGNGNASTSASSTVSGVTIDAADAVASTSSASAASATASSAGIVGRRAPAVFRHLASFFAA